MTGRDRKLLSLGQYPEVSLSKARMQAKKVLAGIPRETGLGMDFAEARTQFLSAHNGRDSTKRELKRQLAKSLAILTP